MDKRIVLASAGSGKTYYIANDFSENERVYLITFTNQNVDNIRKEVMDRFNGILPDNVRVSTFDSFVYNHLIRPFEILSIFPGLRSDGVEIDIEPETDPRKFGRHIKKDEIEHYMLNNRYYVLRQSKFFMNQNSEFKRLALDRLSKFCDTIYIDEFQDYNGWDFKLILHLMEESAINMVAVGDIYQSLVVKIRNDGRGSNLPFSKIESIPDFKGKISKKITIDTTTLSKSRRVASSVCKFVTKNLGIPIESMSRNKGEVIFIDDLSEVSRIIGDPDIVKLVWNRSIIVDGMNRAVNWSYSKGDTYNKVCIILTSSTSDHLMWNKLENTVRNRLYVALTRSLGDVYLITPAIYNDWKKLNS